MHLTRARSLLVLLACALVAGAGGASAALADQNVDLASAGMSVLGDPDDSHTTATPATDAVTGANTDPSADPAAGADGVAPAPSLTEDQLAKLTKPQLVALIARTRARWLDLQAQLGKLEVARDDAESLVDDALEAYGKRLLALFDGNDSAELDPFRQARTEPDPTTRTNLIAQLRPEDQAIIADYDHAVAAAAKAGSDTDAKRAEVSLASTDLDFARDFQNGLLPSNASSEPPIEADHVFATGPIPSIGYFGNATGGGMLSGWAGLAGAALGGIGCTPPDPTLAATGVNETGTASWYGPGFNGQNTANGETYDQEGMTAAHKSLPFGTIVRVYSTTTSRCVFVRINDRGPYVDGRIIDLSHAAAQALGMDGTDSVQIEVWAAPGVPVPQITEPPRSAWPADATALPGTGAATTTAP